MIYLNGNEVERINIEEGITVNYSTTAEDTVDGDDEETFFDWPLDPSDLVAGENVIAVEVHQRSQSSSDLGFDLALNGTRGVSSGGVTWSKVSGPGNVVFGDDESLTSSVSFDQAGTYVLRLETAGGEAVSYTHLRAHET